MWKHKLFAARRYDFFFVLARFSYEKQYLSRLFEFPFHTEHFDLQACNAHGAETHTYIYIYKDEYT